jgi:hypothetical protein
MFGRPTFEALGSISNLSVIHPRPVAEPEGLFRSHGTPRKSTVESLVDLEIFLEASDRHQAAFPKSRREWSGRPKDTKLRPAAAEAEFPT